jgi:hypothetical protein
MVWKVWHVTILGLLLEECFSRALETLEMFWQRIELFFAHRCCVEKILDLGSWDDCRDPGWDELVSRAEMPREGSDLLTIWTNLVSLRVHLFCAACHLSSAAIAKSRPCSILKRWPGTTMNEGLRPSWCLYAHPIFWTLSIAPLMAAQLFFSPNWTYLILGRPKHCNSPIRETMRDRKQILL